ncbi:MAG: tyrosine--tRNA ligase [Nitriliruptorales bacterium]|nr:tyrosine--tRNA ligase [Nitriliruptorales bacterium]
MMTEDSNPLDVLRARGFVQDVTDEAGLRKLFETERVTYYVGFDPTATALHVGSLVGMMAMSWLQRMGHRPIAIAGGATGRIGDPSGNDEERELLDDEQIEQNLAGIRRDLGLVLDLDGGRAGKLVDNYEWLGEFGFLGFLRDVGKHFSVNTMIGRESVKRRLEAREQGISYTEFSYQLLQAYDFAHLYATEGCKLQGGGSDQWGNIVAGVDLVRRLHGGEAFGLVWPLMEGSDGKKFSKSAGNAPWLSAELTSPYSYYQWWLNTDDRDVARFLKLFTFLDLQEIAEIEREHAADPTARLGQQRLAEEATRIIHGDDGLADAQRATKILFGDEPFAGLDDATLADAFEHAPSAEFDRDRLEEGVGLLNLMREVGAASSNGEARRLVEQGAVRINNAKIDDPTREVDPGDLASESTLVLQVGKKRHYLAKFA